MKHYERHIFICENQRQPGERPSCAEKNREILKYLKPKCASAFCGSKKIRIQRAGCLDRCEEGPILVSYPEGKWFSIKSLEDAERFYQHYVKNDNIESIQDLEVK